MTKLPFSLTSFMASLDVDNATAYCMELDDMVRKLTRAPHPAIRMTPSTDLEIWIETIRHG